MTPRKIPKINQFADVSARGDIDKCLRTPCTPRQVWLCRAFAALYVCIYILLILLAIKNGL